MHDALVGLAIASLLCTLPYLLVARTRGRDDIGALQGPKSGSWIYGNMVQFILGTPAGQTEREWFEQYGGVLKFNACFGEERLIVSDAAAMRYILQETGVFIKGRTHQLINLLGFGEGSVIYAHGEDHRRIRAVMNGMFTAARVRELIPTLQKIARALSEEWATASGETVDAYRLLHRTTLQAITEDAPPIKAVMGYDTTHEEEYTRIYEDLLISVSQRSKAGIIVDAILSRLPLSSTKILRKYPPPDLRKLLDHHRMTRKISEKLIESTSESDLPGRPNLFSVLVHTNSRVARGLTIDELKDQFGGITTAGEDTTANSLVWILYVLSQHSDWQAKLREEIKDGERMAGSAGLEYDRLPFLNAVIKEVLRFYPAGSYTEREAAADAVIPLTTPIVTSAGEKVSAVRVNKGRKIVISMAAYNRSPAVWGDDANELNPFRWLDGREVSSGGTIGPYANLSNFIGGPRTCIGWRFAILEIQVITVELVKNFAFSLPEGISIRPASAVTVVPMDDAGRTHLPLIVKKL